MTRRTRVALVGPAAPSRGGIAHAVEAIAGSEELRERYRFVVVRTHAHGRPAAKLLRVLAALARLAGLALARRVDVVHVHSASGSSFARKAAATLLARSLGVPVVFHVHGGAFHRQLDRPGLRGRVLRTTIRRVLRSADEVVALTPGWAEELGRRLGGRTPRVVPNAVELPAPRREPPEPGLVAFLGDLRAEKGVFELVEALALLHGDGVRARAVLAGTGPAREPLLRRARELGLAADALELPGWLDGEAKARLLRRASCFCLPSWEEGLPLALLEAMAAGRAVVATDVGGMPEAARPGREALIVPARDPARLAGALARVLTDPGERERLGAAARARVAAEYSEHVLAERLDELYRTLARQRRRGRRRAAVEVGRA